MKKSEIYHTLLILVTNSELDDEVKLDIMKQLFSDENTALYVEGLSTGGD